MVCGGELATAGCASSPPSLERLEERETEPWRRNEKEREIIDIKGCNFCVVLLVCQVVQTAFVLMMSFPDHMKQQLQLTSPQGS